MENIAILLLGIPFTLITTLILIAILVFAFSIWMFIDCLKREDFPDKTLWVVLLAVGLITGYDLILSVIYYFVVKRKLDN